jgi:putative flippase GtrA
MSQSIRPSRDRHRPQPVSRSYRPAVVENVDDPQSTSDGRAASSGIDRPVLDIGVPVHNEERALESSVSRLGALPNRTLGSQLRRFAAIGIASTAAWAVLYLLLRGALVSLPANAIALVVTAIGNTAANRRLTFGIRGRSSLLRDHAAGLAAFGLALGLTSGTALVLDLAAPEAGRIVEIGVLTIANLVATAVRFVLLRTWIGRPVDTRPSSLRLHHDLERTTS